MLAREAREDLRRQVAPPLLLEAARAGEERREKQRKGGVDAHRGGLDRAEPAERARANESALHSVRARHCAAQREKAFPEHDEEPPVARVEGDQKNVVDDEHDREKRLGGHAREEELALRGVRRDTHEEQCDGEDVGRDNGVREIAKEPVLAAAAARAGARRAARAARRRNRASRRALRPRRPVDAAAWPTSRGGGTVPVAPVRIVQRSGTQRRFASPIEQRSRCARKTRGRRGHARALQFRARWRRRARASRRDVGARARAC